MNHSKFLEMLMDAENYIDSLQEDIDMRVKEINTGRPIPEVIDEMVEQNAEDALTILYTGSLIEDLSEYADEFRLLSELVEHRISSKSFNVRFETAILGL